MPDHNSRKLAIASFHIVLLGRIVQLGFDDIVISSFQHLLIVYVQSLEETLTGKEADFRESCFDYLLRGQLKTNAHDKNLQRQTSLNT